MAIGDRDKPNYSYYYGNMDEVRYQNFHIYNSDFKLEPVGSGSAFYVELEISVTGGDRGTRTLMRDEELDELITRLQYIQKQAREA